MTLSAVDRGVWGEDVVAVVVVVAAAEDMGVAAACYGTLITGGQEQATQTPQLEAGICAEMSLVNLLCHLHW